MLKCISLETSQRYRSTGADFAEKGGKVFTENIHEIFTYFKLILAFIIMLYINLLLTKTIAAQNEVALTCHKVRGLYFLSVVLRRL